jgi:hypothetical protein
MANLSKEAIKAYEVYHRGNPEDLKQLFNKGALLNTLSDSLKGYINGLESLRKKMLAAPELSSDLERKTFDQELESLRTISSKFATLEKDLKDPAKDPKESIKKFTNFDDNSKSTGQSFSDFIKKLIYTIFPSVYEKDKNKVKQNIMSVTEGIQKTTRQLSQDLGENFYPIENSIAQSVEKQQFIILDLNQHNKLSSEGKVNNTFLLEEDHIKYAVSNGISINKDQGKEKLNPIVYAVTKGITIEGKNALEWSENNHAIPKELLKGAKAYLDKTASNRGSEDLLKKAKENINKHTSTSKDVHKPLKVRDTSQGRSIK